MVLTNIREATREELVAEVIRQRKALFQSIALSNQVIQSLEKVQLAIEKLDGRLRRMQEVFHVVARFFATQFHWLSKGGAGETFFGERARLALQAHCELGMEQVAKELDSPKLVERWLSDTAQQKTERDITSFYQAGIRSHRKIAA